jgi:hypothetical protein
VNLAILTTVSNYPFDASCPGSLYNSRFMQSLLEASGQFSEVLLLNQNPRTEDIRNRLAAWSKRHQNQEIDQVFWYFCGHMSYWKDARYCGSEFTHHLPEATSLSNSELDQWLRHVRPRRIIKMIDASPSSSICIPGQEAACLDALERHRADITMCSFQHQPVPREPYHGTAWTRAWIGAALSRRSGKVSYRHIEHTLTNTFELGSDQVLFSFKPGAGQEAFLQMTPALESLASGGLAYPSVAKPLLNQSEHPTLSRLHSIWPDRPGEWPQIQRAA